MPMCSYKDIFLSYGFLISHLILEYQNIIYLIDLSFFSSSFFGGKMNNRIMFLNDFT